MPLALRRIASPPLAAAALTALLSLATAPDAEAQFDLVDDDFEGVPLGTAIDTLPGWDDLVSGFDTFIGRAPDDPDSPGIQIVQSLARRSLLGVNPLPGRYQLTFEVTVFGEGRFRFICPTIIVGMQIIDDSRFPLWFNGNASPPRVVYGANFATRPLRLGEPLRVVIDIDTSSNAAVHVDGDLVGVTPWSATPSPCSTPVHLFWENGVTGDAGMLVDDVGVGTIGALAGCDPAPNSTGAAATLSGPALARLGRGGVVFVSRDLPPSATTLLALSQSSASPTPLGDGRLCLGTPVARLSGTITTATTGGVASQVFDDGAPLPDPYSSPGTTAHVMAGQTWTFQGWYRDTASSGGANLTSAVPVTFAP